MTTTVEGPQKLTRVLPEDMLICAEQALLNMAFKGAQVIDPRGYDITDSLVNQAERINRDFDSLMVRMMPKPLKSIPKPKPPVKKTHNPQQFKGKKQGLSRSIGEEADRLKKQLES